ncbi:hypothetical protein INS49_015630 [Diaporthe citri]|uniref:uncharacterized protein n=1 Tax=Diaporthe citri TaxID=83186 RepID=UPI001C80A3DE|nr:uncharacterized protein INS49_015630 [Diaporthe citri]KAG6356243.1 hypothetical protein INS49_015630 [Diaporthe citri]
MLDSTLTISFAPYVVQFAKRILNPSQHALDALEEDLLELKGPVGLRPETMKVMHEALAPGDQLRTTTKVMLKALVDIIASNKAVNQGNCIKLFAWTRKIVTRASTDAIYGIEKNPFQDADVCDGFWAIDDDFVLLGLNLIPNIIAPKGSRGRDLFFKAMHKYYAADGHKTASALIKLRDEVNEKYGLSEMDTERFNLSVCYGLLVNTVPATSWVIYYVYSDLPLLTKIRKHVDLLVHHSNSGLVTVNIPEVIAGCRLLHSLLQEVLRVHSTNAAGRVVLQDTLINDRYLLKKDALLFIPSANIHRSESAWGPTASTFDPERFLDLGTAKNTHKVPGYAYRAFGRGASICPGRHFATYEILTVLIITVLRFDILPVRGRWEMPKTKSHITTSIMTPFEDIDVRVKHREDMKGVEWAFVWEADPSEDAGLATAEFSVKSP